MLCGVRSSLVPLRLQESWQAPPLLKISTPQPNAADSAPLTGLVVLGVVDVHGHGVHVGLQVALHNIMSALTLRTPC